MFSFTKKDKKADKKTHDSKDSKLTTAAEGLQQVSNVVSSASQLLSDVESVANAAVESSGGSKSKSSFKLPGLKKLTSAAAGLQQLSNTFSSVSSRNQNESSVEETGAGDNEAVKVKSSSKVSSSTGIPSTLNLFSKSKLSTLPGLKIKSAKTTELEKQQKFVRQLFDFFNLHVFTPSSNSGLVRNELDQLAKKFNGKYGESGWNNILMCDAKKSLVESQVLDDSGNDLTFSVVDCLKYLARKHGLPSTICNIFLSSLTSTSTLPLNHKYQLAQTIKYSTFHSKVITVPQYVKCISAMANLFGLSLDLSNTNGSSNNSANNSVDPLVIPIISLLTQSLLMTIDNDTDIDPLNDELLLTLRKFLIIVDANTKVELLRKLSSLSKNTSLSGEVIEKVEKLGGTSDTIDGMAIFETGDSIMYKIGAKNTKNVVADAVKTQQVIQSCYKQNMSESTELENLNLSNALNKRRGKSTAKVAMTAKRPGQKGGSGSDRGWWSQIDTLSKLAGNKPLTESDITWLASCTDYSYTSIITTYYQMEQIAEIFCKIVDYQVISPDIMTQLTINFFSENLSANYDKIRIIMLKTIDSYSKQLGGKLPERMTKALNDFQVHSTTCTRQMKRLIWAIMMQDDANLYQSFEVALFEVESSHTSKISADDLNQSIDYIGRQTIVESRTLELEGKFAFSGKLVRVVLDRKYAKEVRIKCAEIVEDFLTFDKKGLSRELVAQFLTLSKSGFDDSAFVSWTHGEQKLMKSSLTRCVLKTLSKITSKEDAESFDLSEEALADLVRLGTKNDNLELEAYIVVSLGSLINVCSSVHIPNAELLLGKLCRSDRICKETSTVYLEHVAKQNESDDGEDSETKDEDEESDDDDDDDENLVYISSHAANIILRCADKVSLSRNTAGIRNVVDAVQNSKDKMTRILCARNLFEISTIENSEAMSPVFVNSLKHLTMHNCVYDVQVYCTAIYCVNMEKVYANRGGNSTTFSILSDDDCDLLTKLYVIDGSFTLGNRNYIEFVNQPILNVLKEQGKFITFSHDTIQLLTFLLNEEHGLQPEVLEILENYFVFTSTEVGGKVGKECIRNNCPGYLFAPIENMFKSQHGNLFESAGKLMYFLSRKQNCVISGDALCHSYQVLMSTNEFSSTRLLCFKILFAGFCADEIPPHVFHAFDSEFLVSRILHLLPTSTVQAEHLEKLMLYGLGEKGLIAPPVKDAEETNALVQSALKSLLEYQSFGRRLSLLHWTIFEFLFNLEQFQSHVVRCLIVASENYQSLPSSIIQMIFTAFVSGQNTTTIEETYQLDILSLALAIVQNNQILPSTFISHLVDRFCTETAQGTTVGDSEIYDQILLVLTNLAKQGKPLPKLKNVTQHLCNLYINSKKINQKMGVVLKWKSLKAKTKKEMTFEEAAEIIGRLCKFWKKSRNHKHRLEILSALYGIIGSELRNAGNHNVNFESVKHCLVIAMTDRNVQTLESGVQTFLLLNSKSLSCTTSDFELLLSIHSQPSVSPAVRRQLGSFLHQNFDRIPQVLQNQFKFNIELEQMDNKSFVERLCRLLDQNQNYELLQTNPIFYERFLSILSSTNGPEEKAGQSLVFQVVEILAKLPSDILVTLPPKLMDAVGILIASKSDESLVHRCKTLLVKFANVDENVRLKCLSTTFFKFLSKSKDSEVLALAVQILGSQSHLLKEEHDDILAKLKFQLNTRAFFNASGLDPDLLVEFIKHISSLNQNDLDFASENEFHQVTDVYLGILNSDVVDEDGRRVVLNLLLLNYVKCFHSQLSIDELSSFSEIVQKTIQQFATSLTKDVKLCLLVALSYTILVTKGCIEELAPCLRVFTEISQLLESKKMQQHYRHVYSAVFAGISSTIQFVCNSDDHEIGSVVPEETIHLIQSNLASQCSTIRLLSFRAALSLESEDMTTQSSDGVGLITGHILQIYSQVFSTKELAIEEMEKNMSFTTEIAELLFSISYWDLQSLKEENREKWKRVLLTTNFITQFGKTDYEKFELMMKLRDYFRRVSDNDMELLEDILQSLTLLLTREQPSVPSFYQVLKILNLVEMIPNDQLVGILEGQSLVELIMVADPTATDTSKLCANFVGQLETTILLNNVEKLVSNLSAVSLDILQMQVSSLMASTGQNFKLAYNLLQTIDNDGVANVTSLNELVEILVKIRGVDQSFDCTQKYILVEDERKYKLNDLIVLLQSHFLLLMISQKTGEKQHNLLTSRLGKIFKNLLKNGISLEQIQTLVCLSAERTSISRDESSSSVDVKKFRKIFDHVTFQLSQYQIRGEQFLNQLMLALKNSDLNWHPPDIINICNNTINSYVFDSTQGGRKQLDKILDEFKSNNPETYAYFLELNTANLDEIGQTFDQVNNKDFVVRNKEISTWTKSDIMNWASEIRSGDHSETDNVTIVEALVVANYAFHIVTKFYLTDIQILTCIIALLDKANGRESLRSGQLFQVGTGSGKSAIVGIISALTCVLDGNNGLKTTIDIYTSSLVLAQRDAREWSEFYSVFGLSCSHNGDVNDRYISGEKLCYRNDIVYGDCSQFQFDYLRHHYSNLGTLGTRKCSFAVIDEVDTMLIDDSSKLARLSSTIPGMDLIQVLYHCVWDRLTFVRNHLFSLFGTIYYLEGQIKLMPKNCVSYAFADKETNDLLTIGDVRAFIVEGGDLEKARIQKVEVPIDTFVGEHLEKYVLTLIDGETNGSQGSIKLPPNLKSFAKSQIGNWIESSLQAVAYQENVNYIVDDGQVKPVDFRTTGVIQGNTSWNNGLHQFLQIKHGLKLTTESVTTNYLSNIATFRKYGTNVVGFTGTLGSPASQIILTDVYKVKLCLIPEICFKRYVRFPDIVTNDRESWLNEITLTSLQETSKRRGVLVICETIREAELVYARLTKFSQVKVKVYTKNQEEQERQIERIHPGDIIVATNLAGRGTDIKTADIESYGGLHVILSFLPASLRIDEQAFGRTSRQGKNGTGQLIIVGPEYSSGSFGNDAPTLKSDMLIQQRDNAETDLLKHFSSTELPVIKLKDNLFDKFSETFNTLRNKLREQNSSWYSRTLSAVNLASIGPSPIETIYLQAVEERWAMFLRDVESMYKEGKGDIVQVQNEFTDFSDQLLNDFKTDELIQNSNNLYYFIQLGNYQYLMDTKLNQTLDSAERYFSRAIMSDHKFSAPAIVGKAFAYLKGKKGILFDSRESNYKEEALRLLNEARPMLHDEIATFTFVQNLIQRQHGIESTPLENQMVEKVNLYGTYLKNVEATIDIVKKSLRQVLCGGTMTNQKWNGEYKEIRQLPNSVMTGESREIPKDFSQFDKYDLTFNDLTLEDKNDQIALTVQVLCKDGIAEKAKAALQNLRSKATSYVMDKFSSKKEKDDDDDVVKQVLPIVSFSLKNVDPYMVLTELTNTKNKVNVKKFQFNVEALGLDMTSSDNFNCIVSNFTALEPASYHLSFTLDSAKAREKARTYLRNLKDFEICAECETCTKSSIFTDHSENPSSTKQLDTFLDEIKESAHFTIKIFRESVDEVNHIFLALPSHLGLDNISNTSLAINNVSRAINDKVKKTAWEKCLQDCNGGIYLIVETIDVNQGVSVVPILRQFTSDIPLSIRGLPLEVANLLLKDASVSQENIIQNDLKELTSTYCSDRLPLMELKELSARGVTLIVTFNELKFVPWGSVITIAGLAAVQATAGGFLITTGFGATLGMSLINEGMSDLIAAHRIYTTREFSWSQYGVQKAVSLTISAVSMGMSGLKDGAKGAGQLVQGGVSESVVEAGKSVATGKMVLNATIEHSGKNLKSLAWKQVGMAVGETGGRIALKSLADNLTDFCFEQARDGISKKVQTNVSLHFLKPEFKKLLSFHFVLNKKGLENKIQSLVNSTTNPKSSVWYQTWNSIGLPLCQGILSSPQFLGSTVSRAVMVAGFIGGLKEIHVIIDKVCKEISKNLEDSRPSVSMILQSHCGLSMDSAEKVASKFEFDQVKFDAKQVPTASLFDSKEQYEKVMTIWKQLESSQKSLDIGTNTTVSKMQKSVVDTITSHLIRVANSHFVSPVMSAGVGTIVATISAELQDRFLVSHSQSTEEQLKSDEKATFASQIQSNAKVYMLAWQKRDIIAKIQELPTKSADENGGDTANSNNKSMDGDLKKYAEGVIEGADADMLVMFTLAKKNGAKIKIVDDKNYQPTPEDVADGVQIVIYEKNSDPNKSGHYSLRNSDGSISSPVSENDCGYMVMTKITGKSVSELRLQAANTILENPDNFTEIQSTVMWIQNRFPEESLVQLMIGGRSRPKAYTTGLDIDELRELNDRNDEEVIKRMLENVDKVIKDDPSPKDGEGTFYILRLYKDGEEMPNVHKIGFTQRENLEARMKELNKNTKNYTYEPVLELKSDNVKLQELVFKRMFDSCDRKLNPSKVKGVPGSTEHYNTSGLTVTFLKSAAVAADRRLREQQDLRK